MITGERIDEPGAPQPPTLGVFVPKADRVVESKITSLASKTAARELNNSAGRRIDTPVRKSFVRPMTPVSGPIAPLARIYSGGRGGMVAVKLYAALLWRCSAPPYSTEKPARAWATLLDLDDPEGNGARRIKDAMKKLAGEGLIRITENPGFPNTITLRDESGSGRAYQLPSTAYTFAKTNKAKPEVLARDLYFKIPGKLWTNGYIQELSGPAMVMLMIFLAEQAGEGERVWFSTEEFPKRYNISHKTRAAGTAELVERGLLKVKAESLASGPYSTTFDTRRRRKVYELTPMARAAGRDLVAEAAPVVSPKGKAGSAAASPPKKLRRLRKKAPAKD